MQDLRSIPDTPVPTYQDPLYLEDQVPRRRPPIGKWKEGELSWACLQEDLAQAAVGRGPHQAKWNGAGQAEPDFFQ